MISQRRPDHDTIDPFGATGPAADLADQGEPEARLGWVHHLYFVDEASAGVARRRAASAGWHQEWVPSLRPSGRGGALFVARDVVVGHGEVAEARAFFESLCTSVGGSYAGWDVRRVAGHALG